MHPQQIRASARPYQAPPPPWGGTVANLSFCGCCRRSIWVCGKPLKKVGLRPAFGRHGGFPGACTSAFPSSSRDSAGMFGARSLLSPAAKRKGSRRRAFCRNLLELPGDTSPHLLGWRAGRSNARRIGEGRGTKVMKGRPGSIRAAKAVHEHLLPEPRILPRPDRLDDICSHGCR